MYKIISFRVNNDDQTVYSLHFSVKYLAILLQLRLIALYDTENLVTFGLGKLTEHTLKFRPGVMVQT